MSSLTTAKARANIPGQLGLFWFLGGSNDGSASLFVDVPKNA